MAAFSAGSSSRFDDSESEEQTIRIAKYLLPSEKINADIAISQNLRSINKNFPKLREFVGRHNNIKVCALQETWSSKFQYKLDGFQPLVERRRPAGRTGGGENTNENSLCNSSHLVFRHFKSISANTYFDNNVQKYLFCLGPVLLFNF